MPFGSDPQHILADVIGMLKERGFMTFGHNNDILIAPPLIITAEQIKEEMAKMDEVLGIVDKKYL